MAHLPQSYFLYGVWLSDEVVVVDDDAAGIGIGAGPVVVVVVSRVLVTAGSSPPQAESRPVLASAATVRHTRSVFWFAIIVISAAPLYCGPVEDCVVVVVVLVGGGGGGAPTVVVDSLCFDMPLLS